MRFSRHSIALVLVLAMLMPMNSCVYDYRPDVAGRAGYVAIEGDILVGDTCRFDVRLSTDLEDKRNEGEPLSYTLRVEASDGTVFPCQGDVVDLTNADPALEYRLVVDVSSPFSATYESTWAPVETTPSIDDLSWSIEDDGSRLWVNVSTHSERETGYYRWTASETWEYYATYYADHFFAFSGTAYKGKSIDSDAIIEYEEGDNTFFCWKSDELSDILIGSTADLTEDRLVNYGIYSFLPEDRKVSHVYFVELTQRRLTDEAYRFWENLLRNSTNVGGLFSPEPLELRGNIANVDDPDELVLGYVSVATLSRAKLFINNYDTRFSRWSGPSYGDTIVSPRDYRKFYDWQYRVGWFEITGERSGWVWLPKECVDCRTSGGTKDRPSWWINNDK